MADNENNKVRLLTRSAGQAEPQLKPIILKYKKRKKVKDGDDAAQGEKKYSRGLEDVQQLEGHVTHMAQKASRALSKGIDVYEREREQSAREKTDGAIEDFIHNSAKATSAVLKEASDIPVDLADSLNAGSYRKRVRKTLKRASKFIGLWRL
jgi:hypothetical protein